jgi:hypothetical protein
MTNRNQRQDDMNSQDRTALDRELDAALAKFAAVEARAGLEERVLANLRAEGRHAAQRSWWQWPTVAALAMVIVAAISLAWRSSKPERHITTQRPPATAQTDEHAGMQVTNNRERLSIQPHDAGSARQLKPQAVNYPATAIAAAPKLDQFPSPQPLSEQEKMLADYVAEHHQQAILVARARMAELKKDLAEEMEAPSNRLTSDQFVNQQEDR